MAVVATVILEGVACLEEVVIPIAVDKLLVIRSPGDVALRKE